MIAGQAADAALAGALAALGPALAPPGAGAALRRAAAGLPGGAAAQILELRPDAAGGPVDLSRVYLARGGGLARLAAAAAAPGSALAPLAAALADAADDAADAETGPGLIWLERDLGPGAPDTPSVFAAPAERFAPPATLAAFVLRFARRLPVAARDAALAAETLRRLPGGVGLRQVGAMTSRAPAAVRLVLDGVRAAGLPGLLRRLGWPGDPRAAEALAALPPLRDRPLRAHLDVAEGALGPRIGLELGTVALPPAAARAALEGLAAAGLIAPAAVPRLAALSPVLSLPAPADPPADPGPRNGAPGAVASALQMRLNHLKASVAARGSIGVKAYASLLATPAPAGPPRTRSTRD